MWESAGVIESEGAINSQELWMGVSRDVLLTA